MLITLVRCSREFDRSVSPVDLHSRNIRNCDKDLSKCVLNVIVILAKFENCKPHNPYDHFWLLLRSGKWTQQLILWYPRLFIGLTHQENAPFRQSPCHHIGYTGHPVDDGGEEDIQEGELGRRQQKLLDDHLLAFPLLLLCLSFPLCCHASPTSPPPKQKNEKTSRFSF